MTDSSLPGYRLSFAQERIWFLEQLHPGTPAFTVSTVLRVDGALQPSCLRRALAELGARHEALRTRFVLRGSAPAQEVLPHAEITLDITDLRNQPDAGLRVPGLIREHVNSCFDLTTAPLIRAQLVRSADDRAVLLISLHHIICDGGSAAVLLRDLSELYRAQVRGTRPELPELTVHCADFAEWQREVASEQVLERQLEFWRRELDGTRGWAELPTDWQRPDEPDLHGALLSRTLPAGAAAALLEVARDERVSPFMLVLAAYELVIARTAGRADFCVGTSVADQSRPETANLVGCFINLLPIRSDISSRLTLRGLLQRVRERCLRAYAHADLPFERLAEVLAPDRDLGRPPLVEVLLEVRDGRDGPSEVEGVTLTPEPITADVARFDLALDVEIDAGGANLRLDYATGLFSEQTAQLIMDRIDDALAAMRADLTQTLAAVPLRAPAAGASRGAPLEGERRPGQAAEHCAGIVRRCLPGQDAGRAAVRQDSTSWSAGKLRDAAMSTARRLAAQGLGPGGIVAVRLQDGPARIAASLGVWLAGGCLLPLDSAVPGPVAARQAAALGTTITISDTSGEASAYVLPWPVPAGSGGPAGDGETAGEPAVPDPRRPALVTAIEAGEGFTSRSLPGGAVASTVRALGAAWELKPADVCVMGADASAVEVLAALAAESAVVLATRAQGADGAALGSLLDRAGATAAYLPESSWASLAGTGWQASAGFRAISPAAPSDEFTRRLLAAGARILVLPCPAGGGAWYAAGEITEAGAPPATSALPNIAISVIDGTGAPALPGAAGELVLSGPAAPSPGRTGEIVRLSGSGSLDVRRPARSGAPARDRVGGEAAEQPRTAAERVVLDCFAQILDRRDIGIHDEFFAVGGTSLAAARLTAALAEALGVAVPIRLLFAHPTVAELAAAVSDSDAATERQTALQQAERDAVLPAAITPSGPPRSAAEPSVLLTGATGFIGSHLLAELLADGARQVTCLVRGEGTDSCAARLRQALARYSLPVDFSRITVLPGDLGEPALGLDEAAFANLADQADVIYHAGAQMNFVLPYRTLRAANVLGTRELIRLACTGAPSTMHFISTIDARAGDRIPEQPMAIGAGATDGYVLSKKAAEHLVLEAGRRGLLIGVYRPWLVTAGTRSGAVNTDDQLALFLAGILLSGTAPAGLPLPLRIMPVDKAARVIVDLSRAPVSGPHNPIHNLFNPRTTPIHLVTRLLADLGYQLDKVPYEQWRAQLARRTANQLDGLSALLAIDVPAALREPGRIEIANTLARLGHAPGWPDLDELQLRQTVSFLIAAGLVPAPRGSELAGSL